MSLSNRARNWIRNLWCYLITLTVCIALSACLPEQNDEIETTNVFSFSNNSFQTPEDVPLTASVEVNQTSVATRIYSMHREPQKGIVSISDVSLNEFTYTPHPNINGEDSFELSVREGEHFETTVIAVQIQPVNDAPVANALSFIHGGLVISELVSATDIDSASLEYSIVEDASLGEVEIVAAATGAFTYSPSEMGEDQFTYKVSDGALEAVATITLSPGLLGDVTGNGEVSALDASQVAQYAEGMIDFTPLQLYLGDTDKDGVITNGDALIIAAHAVGLIATLPALYGDVTHNGDRSGLDAAYVAGYAVGYRELTDVQRHLGDVNRDGYINALDAEEIAQAAVGLIELPFVPTGLLGDVTGNGDHSGLDASYIAQHVAGTKVFSPNDKFLADVDKDGLITNGDALVVASKTVGTISALPALYGDVTHNGDRSGLDSSYILQYEAGTMEFTDVQKHLGDVNRDGAIDSVDADLIADFTVGNIDRLPIPKEMP